MRTPTIIVADDHPLFCTAIKQLVASLDREIAVISCGSLNELKDTLRSYEDSDLLLLDLDLPDSTGLAALAMIRSRNPDIRIAIISGNDQTASIKRARALGACGYIPKSLPPTEIRAAIVALLAKQECFPELSLEDEEPSEDERLAGLIASLTPQQLRILRAIANGKLNKQIAFDFNITEGTVKGHVTSILRTLGMHRRTQLALAAQRVLLDNGQSGKPDPKMEP